MGQVKATKWAVPGQLPSGKWARVGSKVDSISGSEWLIIQLQGYDNLLPGVAQSAGLQ